MEKTTKKDSKLKLIISIISLIVIILVFVKYVPLGKTLNCSSYESTKSSIEDMLKNSSIENQLEFKFLIRKLKEKSIYNSEKKITNKLCEVGKDKDLLSLIKELNKL